MPRPPRLELSLLCLSLASCAEPLASASQPIVGGATDGEDTAVLALERTDTGSSCTAVLVGARVALTAKHCVQSAGASSPVAPSLLRVGVVGASASSADPSTRWFSVRSVRAVPGSYSPPPSDVSDLSGRDLAVLVLEQDPQLAPLATGPAPLAGAPARVVGFGTTETHQGQGLRRSVATSVRGVQGDVLATSSVTCEGDSGGPLLDAEGRVVGVLSATVGSCGAGESQFSALTLALPLLEAARCEAGEGCPLPDASAPPGDAAPPIAPPRGGCSASHPASSQHFPWGLLLLGLLRSVGRRAHPRSELQRN